ncbi:MAG: sulfotransferase family 2 domain-containing protein [Phycisphaerales bacterium]
MSRFVFPSLIRTETDPRGVTIEHPRDVLFHHFPKTAGSTFRRILETLFPPEQVCPAEIDDEIDALTAADRARYRLYAGHFNYDTVVRHFPDAVKLTFLRDPVARVVSHFHNITTPRRHPETWKARAAQRPVVREFLDAIEGMTLEEFVYFDHPRARSIVCNLQTRCMLRDAKERYRKVFRQMGKEAIYVDEWVEEAKSELERFEFVGVQEHFDLSLQHFAMVFGLRPFGDMSAFTVNVNPVKSPDRRYELSQSVRDDLASWNQMDTALWRHATEILKRRNAAMVAHLIHADMWSRTEAPSALPPVEHPTDAARVVLDTYPSSARGFHALEWDGRGVPFRWSGYENPSIVEIDAAIPGGARVEVVVEALAAIEDRILESVRLELDGHPAQDVRIRRENGGIRIVGHVTMPADRFPRRRHAVKLRSERALEPETAVYRRALALAVHAVGLRVEA